ncbi:hypothetical protein [Brevibacillus reuszeri]|uniref:hypothetical protein n=1 Tax=Brevibacillus reuszeri TaxID=54915 RepID=UPI003D2281D3
MNTIKREDIPREIGVYAWISKTDGSIVYIGKATGIGGLRKRNKNIRERVLENLNIQKALSRLSRFNITYNMILKLIRHFGSADLAIQNCYMRERNERRKRRTIKRLRSVNSPPREVNASKSTNYIGKVVKPSLLIYSIS